MKILSTNRYTNGPSSLHLEGLPLNCDAKVESFFETTKYFEEKMMKMIRKAVFSSFYYRRIEKSDAWNLFGFVRFQNSFLFFRTRMKRMERVFNERNPPNPPYQRRKNLSICLDYKIFSIFSKFLAISSSFSS